MTFFRTSVLIIVFLIAVSWSDTGWAVQSEVTPDQTKSPQANYRDLDDKALIEIFQTNAKEGFPSACKAKSLLSEMEKRQAFEGWATPNHIIASAECSVERKNWKKAYVHIQKWEALEGTEPPGAEWAFRLALLAGARDDALVRLEEMSRFEEPDELLRMTDQTVFHMVRELRRDDLQSAVTRLYSALMQSPHLGKLQPNIRSAAAAHILEERLKSGEQEGADAMLLHITSPFFYVEMLAMQTYQPIWNEIEYRVGPHMEKLLVEDLHIQRAAYQANPEDKKIKGQYGHALLFAGRFEEVIALAKSIEHNVEGVRKWEEDDGWLINLEAYAHDAMGNTVEGDRIFDSFISLDNPANQKNWLVNFVINRASRLVEQKRWEEGLAASKIAERIANKTGNPYSRMLVRRVKACALHNLGRRKEAQTVIADVEVHHLDSLSVAVETFLCVGDRERAAEIMVKGLADEKERSALIEALQKPMFDLFYSDSQLPTVHGELRSHSDVLKAFESVARSIPDRFVPLGSQRRQELIAERLLN